MTAPFQALGRSPAPFSHPDWIFEIKRQFYNLNFACSCYKIKAMYGGDSNFAGSTSKTLSQIVNKATSATNLASSLNPSNIGQAVTFMASVTPQFSGTPTGTVSFADGTTALTTVSMSKGVAKFTISTLASGTHTITATYNGSTSFIGSSATLTQTVN